MFAIYRLAGSLLLTLLFALPLAAQEALDPPGRIGRLGYFAGEVSFRPHYYEDAGPAVSNWPLSAGAVLETGAGRAEAWVDSIALRLDEGGSLEFAALDDRQIVVDLFAGRLAVSIMDAGQAGELLLRLPGGQVRFNAAGRYRFEVFTDRSEVTVFAGGVSVESAGGGTQLAAGKRAALYVDGNLRIGDAGRADDFDHWVAERENATLANTASTRVSTYMTGYQDLDSYGDWSSHADYGDVWMPRTVAADWAPYRFGRWAWVAPWGWTWIDAAPWGFAPFHYGRWVTLGGRWAWVPGQRSMRPVYAPALVAWIGNPGWSVSFGFGAAPAVGWFPLAPREVYVPYFRYSPAYIQRINITHIRDVTIIDRAARGGQSTQFAYRNNPRAVTVLPARQMREGQSIGAGNFRQVGRNDLARAPVNANRDWLAPTAAARRPVAAARPGPASATPQTRGNAQPAAAAIGNAPHNGMAPANAQPSRQNGYGGRPAPLPQRPSSARPEAAPAASPGFATQPAAPSVRLAPAAAQPSRPPATSEGPAPLPQRPPPARPEAAPAASPGFAAQPAAPSYRPAPAAASPARPPAAIERPAPPPQRPASTMQRPEAAPAMQRPSPAPAVAPARPQPAPTMRYEQPQQIQRSAPAQSENRSYRQPEPSASRPAARGGDGAAQGSRGGSPSRAAPANGGRGGR
ncbi:MAG: hypothetical protein FWF20_08485 [Betaproteobacteria bacterium]|nr:hypothetical protein [Betaproteobacteria bacterium]MCL2886802.1 hypothetical protein [Betaproteobacteria bacterium]